MTGSNRRGRAVAGALPVTAMLMLGGSGTAAADRPDFAVTVGVPARAVHDRPQVGAVDSRLTAGGGRLLAEEQLGLVGADAADQARFGAAVLVTDLDRDGFDDLVVGAPGVPGPGRPGRVHLLFGTATGITAARAVTLPTQAEAGDEFGAALALGIRRNEFGGVAAVRDLWIGAPGHDVHGRADAGAVFRYELTAAGAPTYRETVTQDDPMLPGAAETGDRFGEVLGAQGEYGVVVGVPHEDIGGLTDAGAIQQLRTDPSTAALILSREWSQNSPGVPGRAEAGDRFGAALSTRGLAVGVPGEDVGRAADAGLVQIFGATENTIDKTLVPSVAYTQNSPGVPGVAEAGDRFGSAVSDGLFDCRRNPSAAIGAPGEDIGRARDAGSVTLVQEPFYAAPPSFVCPARVLSQGHGMPGTAETGDHVGAAVGVFYGDPESGPKQIDTLLVGIPGEDIGALPAGRDVGRVVIGTRGNPVTIGLRTGDVTGLRYGSVLGSATVG